MKRQRNQRDIAVAVIILILLFSSAIANSLICNRRLDELGSVVEATECGNLQAADTVREDFTRLAFFMSITVNHDDLEDAEECMIEFTEAVGSGDEVALRLAKSRLISAIWQLKRLSGIGIDSII